MPRRNIFRNSHQSRPFDARGFVARQVGCDRAEVRLMRGPFATYRGDEADYGLPIGGVASLLIGPVQRWRPMAGRRRRVSLMWPSRMEIASIEEGDPVEW